MKAKQNGFAVALPFWRQGFATEAATVARDWLSGAGLRSGLQNCRILQEGRETRMVIAVTREAAVFVIAAVPSSAGVA